MTENKIKILRIVIVVMLVLDLVYLFIPKAHADVIFSTSQGAVGNNTYVSWQANSAQSVATNTTIYKVIPFSGSFNKYCINDSISTTTMTVGYYRNLTFIASSTQGTNNGQMTCALFNSSQSFSSGDYVELLLNLSSGTRTSLGYWIFDSPVTSATGTYFSATTTQDVNNFVTNFSLWGAIIVILLVIVIFK